jgi:DNA-directed RNA polymerase subunit RPC12/RpoP
MRTLWTRAFQLWPLFFLLPSILFLLLTAPPFLGFDIIVQFCSIVLLLYILAYVGFHRFVCRCPACNGKLQVRKGVEGDYDYDYLVCPHCSARLTYANSPNVVKNAKEPET